MKLDIIPLIHTWKCIQTNSQGLYMNIHYIDFTCLAFELSEYYAKISKVWDCFMFQTLYTNDEVK